MLRYGKLTTACFAAALALGLAACGSSSDSTKTPMDPVDPAPSACDTNATSQACVDEKKTAMDAAKAAYDAALADKNSTQKQVADAKAAYDAAKTAYDNAVDARNTYLAMQPPTYDLEAAGKAVVTAPETLPTGVTAADGAGESSVRGGTVTVNNADGDNTWSKATWPVGTISGWTGSVWERTKPSKDSIVVYTNIEDAKSVKYSQYYVKNTTGTPTEGAPAGFNWVAWAGVDGVSDDDKGILSLDDDAIPAANVKKLFGAADFGSGQEKLPAKGDNRTYSDEDDVADGNQAAFAGSFNGVAGMYKCNSGSACTVNHAAAGTLEFSDDWTFVPDSTDTTVPGVLTDADYMDFGYWVQTGESDGSVTYTVGTFFRGQTASGDVGSLEGTATYRGGAAGLYTKRAHAPAGDGDVIAAGRFTADAELTAHFVGNDVAQNDQLSISGSIKNFMDGGKAIDAGWIVELNKIGGTVGTGIFNTNPFALDTHFFSGTTTGGGSWSGQFYGTVVVDNDDQTEGNQSTLPSGVAGQFNAGFDNGSVSGAFGATKTAE